MQIKIGLLYEKCYLIYIEAFSYYNLITNLVVLIQNNFLVIYLGKKNYRLNLILQEKIDIMRLIEILEKKLSLNFILV